MRWALRLVLVFTMGFGAISCGPPDSTYPLSDASKAKADGRLEGSWIGTMDEAVAMLHFVTDGDRRTVVVLAAPDPKGGGMILTFDMFPSQMDKRWYMNLRLLPTESEELPADGKPHPYWIAKYEVSKGDELTIWLMDESAVESAINSGKLKGQVRDNHQSPVIKDEELAEFVKNADHQELFDEFGRYKRVDLMKLAGRHGFITQDQPGTKAP